MGAALSALPVLPVSPVQRAHLPTAGSWAGAAPPTVVPSAPAGSLREPHHGDMCRDVLFNSESPGGSTPGPSLSMDPARARAGHTAGAQQMPVSGFTRAAGLMASWKARAGRQTGRPGAQPSSDGKTETPPRTLLKITVPTLAGRPVLAGRESGHSASTDPPQPRGDRRAGGLVTVPRWARRGVERLRDLPTITELVGVRIGIQSQAVPIPRATPVTGRCSARGRRWCPSLSPGRCHFPSTHPTPGLSSGPGRSLGTCFQYKRAVLPPPHKTATLGTHLLAGRDLGKHLAEVEAGRVSVPAGSPRLASRVLSAPERAPWPWASRRVPPRPPARWVPPH